MNKAIFLDRDGTINVEKSYLYKIEDFEFFPGVIEGLKMLQSAGYLLIIVTNQSGIARGYYTEHDFQKLNTWMQEQLKRQGVNITRVYYCPHLPNAIVEKYRYDCECRKPKLGLFKKAIKEYDIDLATSYAIGDKLRDLYICQVSTCHGYLVESNESIHIINQVKTSKYESIQYEKDLLSAVMRIMEHS